jgi:ribulose bisphosphate carboxylase small subunit
VTGPAGGGEQVLGSYLAEIADRLIGPARTRRDILAELGAGLADATDAYRSAGLDPDQAVRAAITEFGRPEQVADGFRPELTTRAARKCLTTGAACLSSPAGA